MHFSLLYDMPNKNIMIFIITISAVDYKMLYYEIQGAFHNHELGMSKSETRRTKGTLWITSE